MSRFDGGDIFRSGLCYSRGRGRIFYFRPGHETLPTYHHPAVQRVITNAVHWAAPYTGLLQTPRVFGHMFHPPSVLENTHYTSKEKACQIKGSALFLAQYFKDVAPYNTLENIAAWTKEQLGHQSRRKVQPGQHLGRHVGNKKGAIFP